LQRIERSPATITDNVAQRAQVAYLPRPSSPRPDRDLNADYAELKRRIVRAGLLKKQPGYYALNAAVRLALLAGSLTVLFTVETFWVQLLNAAFLAFAFTQIGFLGHDAGHKQIFERPARNGQIGLAINLLLGLSRSWWIDIHNQHHVNPNDLELDPHTALPIFAFSEEQARGKRGPLRRAIGYQSFYFFPILFLEGVGVRAASVQYLMTDRAKDRAAEALLIALHFVLYFGIVFYVLSVWQAVAFIAVHQAMFGLYMGSVFAPNHKGMPTLSKDRPLDFLRQQVLTSRNVTGHAATDFVYGGLNYQIEHHLFPSMPRNKLGEAQVIVRAFCVERGIPYRESGIVQSHIEILQWLHETSAPCRAPAPFA